jgi:hypothetical protein
MKASGGSIMAFRTDERMKTDVAPGFGHYLVTYDSANRQVRADLFERGASVTAHVMFPTGMSAANVTDGFYEDLLEYAKTHGFRDRFRVVYFQG